MSDQIDTRHGWREIDVDDDTTAMDVYQLAEYDPATGGLVRAWVREKPVLTVPAARSQRTWIDYADLRQGDVVLEHRHGQVLTEREAPVPPLPTEPHTVIRIHRADIGQIDTQVWIRGDRYWSPLGDHACWNDSEMSERITGFEVLASPVSGEWEQAVENAKTVRRETARAVLEMLQPVIPGHWAEDTAAAFGVENLYVATEQARDFGIEVSDA